MTVRLLGLILHPAARTGPVLLTKIRKGRSSTNCNVLRGLANMALENQFESVWIVAKRSVQLYLKKVAFNITSWIKTI